MQIERLTVVGFRSFGAGGESLKFNAPLTVAWGPNSEGKTNLAEAIEFLFTGTIARRELLASTKDEFEGALRNTHIGDNDPVYVEAAVRTVDGGRRTIRRSLIQDFTKRSDCETSLEIDNSPADEREFATAGLHLGEPPVAAPVLMQHTLNYVFSAGPKQRSDFFKSVLDVTDLDAVRDSIRAAVSSFPHPPLPIREALNHLRDLRPDLHPRLDEMAVDRGDAEGLETITTLIMHDLLRTESPPAHADLDQVRRTFISTLEARMAATFPVEGFRRSRLELQPSHLRDPHFTAIESYTDLSAQIDSDVQEIASVFEAVLAAEHLTEISAPIDCPLCETEDALTPARIAEIRRQLEDSDESRQTRAEAVQALTGLSLLLTDAATRADASVPRFLTWGAAEPDDKGSESRGLWTFWARPARIRLTPGCDTSCMSPVLARQQDRLPPLSNGQCNTWLKTYPR